MSHKIWGFGKLVSVALLAVANYVLTSPIRIIVARDGLLIYKAYSRVRL